MNEPLLLQAGEITRWSEAYSNFTYVDANGVTQYPKASEWTLTYYFKNATANFSVAAAANVDDYLVTIAAAVSVAYVAGDYTWMAYIHKGAGPTLERYLVASGSITVKPTFVSSSNYDNRSFAKKMVDTLRAALAADTTRGVIRVQVDGKSVEYAAPADAITALTHWETIYEMEVRAERTAKGLGHKGNIYVRFTE
jgi:hypothetical protein